MDLYDILSMPYAILHQKSRMIQKEKHVRITRLRACMHAIPTDRPTDRPNRIVHKRAHAGLSPNDDRSETRRSVSQD
jgi:hypothetical protein